MTLNPNWNIVQAGSLACSLVYKDLYIVEGKYFLHGDAAIF